VIGAIKITEYAALTRGGGKKEIRASLKKSWENAGRFFHLNLRDKRFTKEHALKAGYTLRKGEDKGTNSKEFFRSYTGRKLKKYGHTRPLEFSGGTRSAMRAANISSTSSGARVAYPGARLFNYRNPFSNPTMNLNLEFRKILPEEAVQIAKQIESEIDSNWVFNNASRTYVNFNS
jgi:hypothetical protein